MCLFFLMVVVWFVDFGRFDVGVWSVFLFVIIYIRSHRKW